MSVYTAVDADQLDSLLSDYSLGTVKAFTGIEAGIENTNYFVTTTRGEYVLTIFEHVGVDELQFDLQLMEHMATAGIPCPLPVHRNDGELLTSVGEKPAALLSKLSGKSPSKISLQLCSEIGHWLARLHLAGQDFPLTRNTPRDQQWAVATLAELQSRLPAEQYDLLAAELEFQNTVPRKSLPQGIIHGDLFSDNVLFSGDKLTGLLDLYDASTDAWLYDIAITANAWCSQPDGSFDRSMLAALLQAYQQIRPLQKEELAAWPAMTRAAALRFWLSRLHHREFHRPGELTQIKPPEVYETILRQRLSELALKSQTCG